MCGCFYTMDIKHSKRIRKKHHWPPQKAAHSAPSYPSPEWRSDKDTTGCSQPRHQTHNSSSSSLSQAKRLNWKQLLLSSAWLKRAQNQNSLSISERAPEQSGISELCLVTSRAWDHFLVLTDPYPPCPLHHCRRDTEQVLSWDASSSSVTEHVCMHAHVCSRARPGGERDHFKVTLYFQHKTYNFN